MAERFPGNFSAALGLAEAAFETSRWKIAKDKASWCVKKRPRNYRARMLLGAVYHRFGRIGDALQQYENALRHAPAGGVGDEIRDVIDMLQSRL